MEHTIEEHREWEATLRGVTNHITDHDILNKYADLQQHGAGVSFCINCKNPLCEKCYRENKCVECGHKIYN